ncbi:peptide chain release factor N(5)-glutamine methyltransferase [Limosilactobacillus ingluviei]|uniref:peptide chain release factor N(5)-glutamine methyltransferase n=1 Tax=Limosilactobacillus ingluviei TaxID=148604 RepID=UPI0024B8B745|nr:peptide chain release factor N(5)-glutamine methyltransferase [Limosilactobacillus ingluviei]
MSKWTYFEAQQWASSFLKAAGMDPATPQFILEMIHDWKLTDLVLHNREIMPADEAFRFTRAVERIANAEPAQYVVGKAPFFGRVFVVNRDVLIPESETEELVEWVLATMPADRPLRVLDLGTGSGVIGITLALERPRWQVTLSDISTSALRVALANQRLHGTNLRQVESDLFAGLAGQKFDLIVTNPPYIAVDEVNEMDRSVIEYVPPLALFASEGGLGFYRRLFTELPEHLVPGGVLFGETGYKQEQRIQDLFHRTVADGKIQTKHDMADRMRMIRVDLGK